MSDKSSPTCRGVARGGGGGIQTSPLALGGTREIPKFKVFPSALIVVLAKYSRPRLAPPPPPHPIPHWAVPGYTPDTHTGNATSWAPALAAWEMKSHARETFADLSAPTAS